METFVNILLILTCIVVIALLYLSVKNLIEARNKSVDEFENERKKRHEKN
jgi:hypothetical protein